MKTFRNFLALGLFLLSACTQQKTGEGAQSATQTTNKVINLAIWTGYVTPQQLEAFQKATGYKVSVSNYSSNEELLAKLQAGADGYDVIVPSDYMVEVMAHLNLLQEITAEKLSNFKDLNPQVLGKYYDAKNRFSVPFGWGTTGLAYNKKTIKDPVKSWKEVFARADLSGKVTFLDDVRETLGAALKAQGRSLNTKAESEITSAKKLLLENKKRIRGFISETEAGLVNGEMAVAQSYSHDALLAAKRTNGAIQYVIPEEGCTLWIDNLAIPKGAKNIEGARALIDYLLNADVSADRATTLLSAPSNLKALEKLPENVRNNGSLFPTAEQLSKCEMLEDLGDDLALWDRAWTEVKASN